MRRRLLIVMLGVVATPWVRGDDKWGKEVAAVAARIERASPAAGGVVFAGSSSIRLWDLERDFPGQGYVNAGFGGSTLADCTRHAAQLVHAWNPRAVVLYAGDNDLANGLSADAVVRDFLVFAADLHAVLPDCQLVFLSIKPSASRWHLWPRAQEANARIRSICEAVGPARLKFLDVATPLLGSKGEPDASLFDDDRLHVNEAGYRLWRAVVEPALRKGE